MAGSTLRGVGCLPDPPDARDELHAFGAKGPTPTPPLALPDDVDLREHEHGVLDQRSANWCVSHAGFQGFRVRRSAMGTVDPLGAVHFGYYLARSEHGMADIDLGTYNRAFFRAVARFGFLASGDDPYGGDLRYVNTPPRPVAYHRAFDQKTRSGEPEPSYRRILETGQDRLLRIRQALAMKMPVVFGTEVSKAFREGRGVDRYVLSPPVGEPDLAGHAALLMGYSYQGHFLCLNSYGVDWGIEGYCWMSAEYLTWPLTRDLWVIDRPPAYVYRS